MKIQKQVMLDIELVEKARDDKINVSKICNDALIAHYASEDLSKLSLAEIKEKREKITRIKELKKKIEEIENGN